MKLAETVLIVTEWDAIRDIQLLRLRSLPRNALVGGLRTICLRDIVGVTRITHISVGL